MSSNTQNGSNRNGKILCVANQKGGTGKTTTAWNLGYAIAKEGMSVLLADFDPQANLTMGFGIENPHELETAMSEVLEMVMKGKEVPDMSQYIHKGEKPGITLDLIPANQTLTITEVSLQNAMSREDTLSELLNPLREHYDFIIIDSNPFLGLLTINALTACNEVIIPVSPQYWSATGLTDLIDTIGKIKRKLNPKIKIGGILLTICDERTKLYKDTRELVETSYGGTAKIFNTAIPSTTKIGEANYYSLSIMEHDPSGRASMAYTNFAKEVLGNAGIENKETATNQATA
jgi:chromosome partitioning protein